MNKLDYHHLLAALESLMTDTLALLARFQAEGMEELLSDDYARLEQIYQQACAEHKAQMNSLLTLHASDEKVLH